jgi:hypothetical protein
MLRTESELVGEGCGIDMGPKGGMLCDIVHTFAIVINDVMEVLQALDVIFSCHNVFHIFPS